jgi:hypothetical protein
VSRGTIEILPELEVDSPLTDKIRVYVYDNFYCPDIYVEHRSDSDRYESWDLMAESDEFKQLVIDTLINCNKLPIGPVDAMHEYRLCRAEMGAQSSHTAVFECLFRDGTDWAEEWVVSHGATSRNRIEKESKREHCLARYARAETREDQELAVFVALQKNWGNNYRGLIPKVVQFHLDTMSRQALEQAYMKSIGSHPSGEEAQQWAREYIRHTDDLEEFLHSIEGIKENT